MKTNSFLLSSALLLSSLPAAAAPRLYWFVPDGLRTDHGNLSVFRFAEEGHLPNIKKMMENGAWGQSVPVYPSHTPSNFAALMTGAYPEVNGVPDGPMRVEGYPLAKPSVAGFSSTAKKVAPVWKVLEQAGRRSAVLSVPGSTPPEIDLGPVIRGRWANWGADMFAVNFESFGSGEKRFGKGKNVRLFQLGAELTKYPQLRPAEGWAPQPGGFSPPLEMELLAHGATIFALLTDGTDNGTQDYDRVVFALDRSSSPLAELGRSGEWTAWLPIRTMWNGQPLEGKVRLALIRLGPGEFLKVRAYFDLLNPSVVNPPDAFDGLYAYAGPMADFPDNWPAQLNDYPEEKGVFLAEARMTMDWHRRAAGYFMSVSTHDAVIHDIYTPNQMLESRWWLPYLDRASARFKDVGEKERAALRGEVLEMYKGMDAIIGEALKADDGNTVFVLSSDHGVIPLDRKVLVNNLLAREGLLKFDLAPVTGEPQVEWGASRAAYLKMHGVYLGTAGLDGNWTRGSGPEYEELRERVMELLRGLKDGDKPAFAAVLAREDAARAYRLPLDRIADIVLVMTPGYGLSEDMTEDLEVFKDPVEGGYKQALDAARLPGMWTPFVVYGPGVKKGFRMTGRITSVDQAPTILRLLGVDTPPYMQGRAAEEIFDR